MTAGPSLAVEATNVWKIFDRTSDPYRRFGNVMKGVSGSDGFVALRDVSLSVARGEAVGLIGRNGAGKSTLLQLVCGTTEPTRGTIAVHGRLGAMLELGAGFNPRFSGRENALLSAAAYGLEASPARLRSVESFAEIGRYFNRPLSEYSSGMQARLAFAICAHIEADILVVDEVLGTGDAAFQGKCRRFLDRFRAGGGTLLFASHDPGAVIDTCDHALWLEGGAMAAAGPAGEVMRAYSASLYGSSAVEIRVGREPVASKQRGQAAERLDPVWGRSNPMEIAPFDPTGPRHGFGGCRIDACFFSRDGAMPLTRMHGGTEVTLHIVATATRALRSPIAGFLLRNESGQNLFGDNTFLAYADAPLSFAAGESFEAQLVFAMPYLPAGRYFLAPSVIEGTQLAHTHLDWREEAVVITVAESPVAVGKVGVAMEEITVRPA